MGIEGHPDRTSMRMSEVNPNTKWTLEILAGAITALKELDQPVNPRFLQINHTNLYAAMAGFPGGWKRVVQEAGCDPDEERRGYIGAQRLWGR